MEQQEIWKPIKGWEGFYEISNFGRIKSLERWYYSKGGRHIHINERILKACCDSKGYPFVLLSKDNKAQTNYIHRLVAEHFIPNPNNKPEIDHIDTNPLNFSIENLRWCTRKENCNNPTTIKNRIISVNKEGVQERKIQSHIKSNSKVAPKKTYMYDIGNHLIKEFNSISDAARYVNGCASAICVVIDKTNRSSYGYKWYSKRLEPQECDPNQKEFNNKVHQLIQLTLW